VDSAGADRAATATELDRADVDQFATQGQSGHADLASLIEAFADALVVAPERQRSAAQLNLGTGVTFKAAMMRWPSGLRA
jgi:hypothetical protein